MLHVGHLGLDIQHTVVHWRHIFRVAILVDGKVPFFWMFLLRVDDALRCCIRFEQLLLQSLGFWCRVPFFEIDACFPQSRAVFDNVHIADITQLHFLKCRHNFLRRDGPPQVV